MGKSNWSDIGNHISEVVQTAIDEQDYSRLSQSIQDAVNTVVTTTVGGAVRQAQNPWKSSRTSEKPAEASDSAVFAGTGPTRIKGYLLTFFGSVGCLGFGIGLFVILLGGYFWDGSALTVGIPAGILTPFLLVSMMLFSRGMTVLGRVSRFKQYVRALRGRGCIAVKELAAAIGKGEKRVQKDVRRMIERGMFRQGHLDEAGKSLFVTDQGYEAYLQAKLRTEQQNRLEKQREQQENAYKRNEALPEEAKNLIAQGRDYIDKIHAANDAIKDEIVSAKLDDLELIVTKIFQYVEQNPQCASETRKLMKYYLPTTIKLLDSYQKISIQPVRGENIQNSKKQIEETLDTLNQAFARLFDNLYEDVSVDIHSDISVLNTMLAQEGLTGDRL